MTRAPRRGRSPDPRVGAVRLPLGLACKRRQLVEALRLLRMLASAPVDRVRAEAAGFPKREWHRHLQAFRLVGIPITKWRDRPRSAGGEGTTLYALPPAAWARLIRPRRR